MIKLTIAGARVKSMAKGAEWWVVHPCNDAILAYCSTREEADRIVRAIDGIAASIERHNGHPDCVDCRSDEVTP